MSGTSAKVYAKTSEGVKVVEVRRGFSRRNAGAVPASMIHDSIIRKYQERIARLESTITKERLERGKASASVVVEPSIPVAAVADKKSSTGQASVNVVELIEEMRSQYGISRDEVARMVACSTSSIDKWKAGAKPTELAKKSVRETASLLDSLGSVMEKKYVGEWLRTPNSAFGDAAPIDIIKNGHSDRISLMIYEIQTGQPD